MSDLISREALKKAIEECKYCGFYGKLIEIIDNAPSAEEITNEDIQQAIKEGFANGYEMAKEKFSQKKGAWIVTAEDTDGVHRICCPFCSYEKGSNNTDPIIFTFFKFPKFCEGCGADMRGVE